MIQCLVLGQHLSLEKLLSDASIRDTLHLNDSWATFCEIERSTGCQPTTHEFVRRLGATNFSLTAMKELIARRTGFELLVQGDLRTLDWTTLAFAMGKRVLFDHEPTLADVANAFEYYFDNKTRGGGGGGAGAGAEGGGGVGFSHSAKSVGCVPWTSGKAYEPRFLLRFNSAL